MSWIPNFLNLGPAAIAAAVAIPSLLVLYFLKLRRREMAVPSTLLWKKAIQDLQVNAPFQKLRKNLLLLLQMLLLVLLILALARPVISFTPGAGKVSVILIDRSASMNARDVEGGHTRLEEAKRRAKALVETLDRNAQAMVIAFDDAAETVQSFTSDVNSLKRAIDSIQPTDRRSRLKLAYQLAEAQTNFNPDQLRSNAPRPEVFLYSDARVLDASELSIRGEVKLDRIGTDTAPNIAIVALDAKRNYERPEEVQVFARLADYGPTPTKADVELRVDGQVMAVKSVSLAPERWNDSQWLRDHPDGRDATFIATDSIEFTVDLPAAAVITVEQMNKQQDVLAADDSAALIVPPPKPLAVLLVTDGNYFLERAVNAMQLKNPVTMSPAEYERKKPTAFDVILFDRYAPKKELLPPAGNYIFFGALPAGMKLAPAMHDGRPVTVQDIGILDWKRDHPLLRNLQLGRLYVGEALKLDVPRDDEVLIDGLKCPLLVLHHEGRSTELVIAFDVIQSNWPLKISFPIFLHNALQFMALGSEMNVRQSYQPGAAPELPRASLVKADPDLKTLTLTGPTGRRRLAIPSRGDFALPALDRVGIYQLDPPIPGYEKMAVNLLDPNESNLVPAKVPPGGAAIEATGRARGRLELWWWIIAATALPLLLIEWYVYTRRVHL
jgi:hypothetical protein